MLSRVAESLFWLGRNVERAETIARILDVNYSRAMDLYSRRDGRGEGLWRSVMRCAGFVDEPKFTTPAKAAAETLAHCAFDPSNPTSIVSCVRVARTNALALRAEMSIELWEVVNVLYLFVDGQSGRGVLREGPSRFLRRVRDAMQTFAGVGDATLSHGDGWNFLQIGRFVERGYMTARMLGAIDAEDEVWAESQRLLEMCCASAPFMQASRQEPEPRDALAFIILSQDCPRSMRFCTREADAALHRISRSPAGTFANDAERRLGRLRARLDFTSVEELLQEGVGAFASGSTREVERLSNDIESAYFPSLPAGVRG